MKRTAWIGITTLLIAGSANAPDAEPRFVLIEELSNIG